MPKLRRDGKPDESGEKLSPATKAPKSGRARTVTLNVSCVELLQRLKQQHLLEQMKPGTAWKGDDWVFTQWDGSIMHTQIPSKQFDKILKKNSIPHRKFHSLRHTSATLKRGTSRGRI